MKSHPFQTEATEQGEQSLVPGVQPITQRESLPPPPSGGLQVLCDAPLAPSKVQKPLNIGLAACPPAREAGPGE